ncbi:MAG: hypothetical protein R2799_16365 [Crocinitomicaceae bacterium]|nr:hypothetical protein [Crocinitomicaceae bacterium]
MNTSIISIVYFAFAALFGALGQYLYKTGAESCDGSFGSFVRSPKLFLGVLCYFIVMVLFIAAFRKGGSLTVLYPIYASTFIWAAIIAFYAYGTPIKPINLAGMVALVLGMYLMGKS